MTSNIKKFINILDHNKSFISQMIPILFKRVHKENSRGGKLGMEVGKGRERALIALFKEVVGEDYINGNISDAEPEVDCILQFTKKEEDLSIKTFSGNIPNIKLSQQEKHPNQKAQ